MCLDLNQITKRPDVKNSRDEKYNICHLIIRVFPVKHTFLFMYYSGNMFRLTTDSSSGSLHKNTDP